MSGLGYIWHLAEFSEAETRRSAVKGALSLAIGPFRIRLRSHLRDFLEALGLMYAHNPTEFETEFADFHVALDAPRTFRRWLKPQAEFLRDGESPFAPFPADHAFPLFEWGLNWCVATRAHQYLMLHAAVVERNGKAIVMPAWPGAGKSTLTAALVSSGWRLLSDEFGLVRPVGTAFTPFPRCIPLKNESIEVIRQFAPDAVIGRVYEKTRKGRVAHMRPPEDSIRRMNETVRPVAVIFPRFLRGEPLRLRDIGKAEAFLKLAGNAFNYELLGAEGFCTVREIIESCECRLLQYSDLNEAVGLLEHYSDGSPLFAGGAVTG